MSKPIPNNIFKELLRSTNDRVILVRKLPTTMQMFFVIEGIKILDLWDDFYKKMHAIQITLRKETDLSDGDFNMFLFYVQIIGGFYIHNGQGHADDAYAELAKAFIIQNYETKQIGNAEYGFSNLDLADVFYKAFPHKKK